MTPGTRAKPRRKFARIRNAQQLRIQNPVSTVGHEGLLILCFTQAAGPEQPARRDGGIDRPWVAAAPNGAISIGSGKLPRI